jgi:uncharacterized protein YydD (DUF2326 family)
MAAHNYDDRLFVAELTKLFPTRWFEVRYDRHGHAFVTFDVEGARVTFVERVSCAPDAMARLIAHRIEAVLDHEAHVRSADHAPGGDVQHDGDPVE